MRIPIYQVDAFTDRLFAGNPAAVCPLERWLPDQQMQAIANENNLSETAFFIPEGAEYSLRWFTPQAEVDLCGHATLATGFVILTRLERSRQSVAFESRSGRLEVARDGDAFVMDFPARRPAPRSPPVGLGEALGHEPQHVWAAAEYWMPIYRHEDEVAGLQPDMRRLVELELRAVCATAPGQHCDFVSRFFAPLIGVPEDPVTGSAHCMTAPYWADELGKTELNARQISRRGGEVRCRVRNERVDLLGRAVLYLEGFIEV